MFPGSRTFRGVETPADQCEHARIFQVVPEHLIEKRGERGSLPRPWLQAETPVPRS